MIHCYASSPERGNVCSTARPLMSAGLMAYTAAWTSSGIHLSGLFTIDKP